MFSQKRFYNENKTFLVPEELEPKIEFRKTQNDLKTRMKTGPGIK